MHQPTLLVHGDCINAEVINHSPGYGAFNLMEAKYEIYCVLKCGTDDHNEGQSKNSTEQKTKVDVEIIPCE